MFGKGGNFFRSKYEAEKLQIHWILHFFDNLPTTIFFSAIPHRVIDAFHSDWLDYSAQFWSCRYIAESESRNLKEIMPLKEVILGADAFSLGIETNIQKCVRDCA